MTDKTKELNGQVLNQITNANHTSEVVMTHLALRTRNRIDSDVDSLRVYLLSKKEQIEETDYSSFWKSLAHAGVGAYIRGRKGNHDRFKWYYPLKAVADSAINCKDVKTEPFVSSAMVTKARPIVKKPVVIQKSRVPRIGVPKVSVQNEQLISMEVRPGLTISIRAPQNFSKEDVRMVSKSLEAIAK